MWLPRYSSCRPIPIDVTQHGTYLHWQPSHMGSQPAPHAYIVSTQDLMHIRHEKLHPTNFEEAIHAILDEVDWMVHYSVQHHVSLQPYFISWVKDALYFFIRAGATASKAFQNMQKFMEVHQQRQVSHHNGWPNMIMIAQASSQQGNLNKTI